MYDVNTPEILDFLSHHRNLLVHFVDAFAAAGTHRTHGCDEETDYRKKKKTDKCSTSKLLEIEIHYALTSAFL